MQVTWFFLKAASQSSHRYFAAWARGRSPRPLREGRTEGRGLQGEVERTSAFALGTPECGPLRTVRSPSTAESAATGLPAVAGRGPPPAARHAPRHSPAAPLSAASRPRKVVPAFPPRSVFATPGGCSTPPKSGAACSMVRFVAVSGVEAIAFCGLWLRYRGKQSRRSRHASTPVPHRRPFRRTPTLLATVPLEEVG